METEKSFSGEEAEKDFCGRLFFLAAIFPFSNEKACLGVTAKTDFFYRLTGVFSKRRYRGYIRFTVFGEEYSAGLRQFRSH